MPEIKTIKQFSDTSQWQYNSEFMKRRQRCNMPWIDKEMNGNLMMMRYIKRYFREPRNFIDYVYLSQCSQWLGMEHAIIAHRSNMPKCMGSLYWQINDCWPTMSWSTVDYYGNWKPAHYVVRSLYANKLLVWRKTNKGMQCLLINDIENKIPQTLSFQIFNTKTKLWQHDTVISEYQWGSSVVKEFTWQQLNALGDTTNLIFNVNIGASSHTALACRPLNFKWSKSSVETTFIKGSTKGIDTLLLQSNEFTGYVILNSSKNIKFSDNAFHLLAGCPKKIVVQSANRHIAMSDIELYYLNK